MNRVTLSQRSKGLIIIWCCLCITVTTNCDKSHDKTQEVPAVHGTNDDKSLDSNSPKNPLLHQQPDKNTSAPNSNTSTPITSNRLSVNPSSTTHAPNSQDPFGDNDGAIERGVLVFLGLGVIVIAYITFRCVRLNKNRTQMVRKYGVLAHRQDVEMRPLPLDEEDEDDTTVFDVSEVGVHEKPRRNK